MISLAVESLAVATRNGARCWRGRVSFALSFLTLLAVCFSAAAQNATVQPSQDALDFARQIVKLRMNDVLAPILPEIIETTKTMFTPTHPTLAKDLDQAAETVRRQYEPRIAELIDQTAHIYAAHFTEQELHDLLAFYQTPLAKKASVEEPKALDESLANAQIWADHLRQDVIASMRAEMARRGHPLD